MAQPDKRTDLFVKFQSAVEASRGGITWTDIALGTQRALERKRQECVAALVNSMPLSDLMLMEEIAHREIGFSTKSPKTVEIIQHDKPAQAPVATYKSKKRRAR